MASLSSRAITLASTTARRLGASLDSLGSKLEVAKISEKLNPSTRIVAYGDSIPATDGAFVAPTASVIGDVVLDKGVSVWYGATVRGDVASVKIGEKSSIGDCAVVHVARIQTEDGNPVSTEIGSGVTVGANAVIHAAVLKDNVSVGAGAQVLDGAVVQENSVVESGAIVTPGTVVNSGELWAGSPAKMVRKLTEDEIASIGVGVEETMELAAVHASECAKTFEQVKEDEEEYYDKLYRGDDYFQPLPKDQKPAGDHLGKGQPGRIFNTEFTWMSDEKVNRT